MRVKYVVEGADIDCTPLALAQGLRDWGWPTLPEADWIYNGKMCAIVGAAEPPRMGVDTAYTNVGTLVLNPMDKEQQLKREQDGCPGEVKGSASGILRERGAANRQKAEEVGRARSQSLERMSASRGVEATPARVRMGSMNGSPLLGGVGNMSARSLKRGRVDMMEEDGMWPEVDEFTTPLTGMTPAAGRSVGKGGLLP